MPYPRSSRVGTVDDLLRDDRNLDLGCFPLYRNGLFRLLQSFDVTADGALGHGSCVLQVLAFRHKSRERGDRHRVAAVFVRFEKSSAFADSVFAVLHFSIVTSSALAHHFGTSLLQQR
jgi:hypothetical protein